MTDDTPDTVLDQATRRQLKRIAHHLNPVVLVGDRGISEAVVTETNRALADHELIKVRIASADRDDRNRLIDDLATACGAVVVQRIGKICVLYRRNPEPNPKLSNLSRFGL
jgi:RNA-binding protein